MKVPIFAYATDEQLKLVRITGAYTHLDADVQADLTYLRGIMGPTVPFNLWAGATASDIINDSEAKAQVKETVNANKKEAFMPQLKELAGVIFIAGKKLQKTEELATFKAFAKKIGAHIEPLIAMRTGE